MLKAMNKDDLTKRVARESRRSRAEAADDVDTLVYQLLKDLKRSPATPRREPVKAPVNPPLPGVKPVKAKS
jgi:hypothetical protein